MLCPNCSQRDRNEIVQSCDSNSDLIATSNGVLLNSFRAQRIFCSNCACYCVVQTGGQSQKDFYAQDYDLSERFQNNWIYKNGERAEKHDLLLKNIVTTFGKSLTGSFLEVGCGKGSFLLKLAKEYGSVSWTGLDPQAPIEQNQGNFAFIRNFFEEERFDRESFDGIVCHSLINRISPYKAIQRFSELLKKDGKLSLEFVHLENSDYAPYVWDHGYTFLSDTIIAYLEHWGFEVIEQFDCVSTQQVIALKRHAPRVELRIPISDVDKAKLVFEQSICTWESRVKKFYSQCGAGGSGVGLFGAGLYSTVFGSLIGTSGFNFVVDERFEGKNFLGTPVKKLDEVGHGEKLTLCVRPEYREAVISKLKAASISFIDLDTSDPA